MIEEETSVVAVKSSIAVQWLWRGIGILLTALGVLSLSIFTDMSKSLDEVSRSMADSNKAISAQSKTQTEILTRMQFQQRDVDSHEERLRDLEKAIPWTYPDRKDAPEMILLSILIHASTPAPIRSTNGFFTRDSLNESIPLLTR